MGWELIIKACIILTKLVNILIIYAHHPRDASSLSGHSIHCLYEDRQGILWVGMEDSGLDQFNIGTETFTHYRYQAQEPGSLSSDRVHCIVEDEAGILWVGTGNGFKPFLTKQTKSFKYYGPTYGYACCHRLWHSSA